MPDEEPKLTFEQPRSSLSTWLGIVLLFAFFGLLVWAVMRAMPRGDQYEAKRVATRLENLKKANEGWKTATDGYAWADKAKGTVRVPVSRAMEMTVAELAQKKPAPAAPIAPDAAKAGMQVTAPDAPPPGAPPALPAESPKATAIQGKDSESAGQPAAAANPPNAPAGTQPGPSNTPAGPPSSTTREFQQGGGQATPVQSPPGTPAPVPGRSP